MQASRPFHFRTSQRYGWPFYIARRILRGAAERMWAAADLLSQREKYPSPIFLRPLLPQNVKLKDIHRGRRCFVIGTGPSLKNQDIAPLAGEITFAMNGFLNHPSIDLFQPTYYCLVDPCYFDGSAPSDRFLGRLFDKVHKSHLILPYSAAEQVLHRWKVPASRVTFVTFCGNLATCRLRSIDVTRPLPTINNCAQLAILLALYTGCSTTCLLGMDHNWAATKVETHFYAQKTLANHPVAHGEYWKYQYRMVLEDVLKVWKGYENIRRYAEAHGQQIVNCTDGGFLDVFEREEFQQAPAAAFQSECSRASHPISEFPDERCVVHGAPAL